MDEPANVAFAVLIYETISPANRLTPEFLHGLWKLGVQYARLEALTEADHEALRRLFRYFIATWEGRCEHLLIQMMGPPAKPMIIKAWMVLAKSSMALWEWEEAVNCYKKIAVLRAENGDTAKATEALFDAVGCLQTVFLKKEALALSHQMLMPEGEELAAFGLPSGFQLDAAGREAIEVNMVNLLDEVNLSDKTLKTYTSLLQTNAAKSLYRLHMGMEADYVTSEDLQLTNDALSNFYGTHHGTGEAAAYNRAVYILLHLLNDNRGADYIGARMQEVSPFEKELPDELKLLHQLNLAKLAYLQDDPACLNTFEGLLPQMYKYPDPFDEPRKSQWLTSCVRAWHLALPGQPERIGELEDIALQAINNMLKGYLVRYRDRSALASLMNESEELIKALLLNEAFVQKDMECSQRLLRMVWNVLMLRKDFLNRYLGKAGLEIVHESRYLGQVAAL